MTKATHIIVYGLAGPHSFAAWACVKHHTRLSIHVLEAEGYRVCAGNSQNVHQLKEPATTYLLNRACT